jgi:hypothetical protein
MITCDGCKWIMPTKQVVLELNIRKANSYTPVKFRVSGYDVDLCLTCLTKVFRGEDLQPTEPRKPVVMRVDAPRPPEGSVY